MKKYMKFFKTCIILFIYSHNLIGQTFRRCPCQNVETELMPDSTIQIMKLQKLEINTSYISWNDFLAIGDDVYPENDEIFDEPHNFSTYCFGCTNNKLFEKKTQQVFTGEITFLRDVESTYKNVPIQKIQIKAGLKNGLEVHYDIDVNLKCYYPRVLTFMKDGTPYKKLYEFEYIDAKLQIKNEESYKDGMLHGISRTYDNYGKNGHQLIYEANIVKFPNRECCYMKLREGIGEYTTYPIVNNEIEFEGKRIAYYSNTGKINWIEQWKEGRIKNKISYYDETNITCNLKRDYPYQLINYTFISDEEFIEEEITYFSDCNSSIEQVRNNKNYQPYGKYEKYSKPGQLLEKGNYDNLGQKQGIWELYTEKGVIIEKTNYESDQINGIQELYNEKGILFRKLKFKNDKIIEIVK